MKRPSDVEPGRVSSPPKFRRREWGVATADGVSVVLAGGEDLARSLCDTASGERVVFRDLYATPWATDV